MKKRNILLGLALAFCFTACYDLDKMPDDEVRIRTGMTYAQLRSAHAGASIVPILHQHGIHMLSCYEGTKPNHGLSYLCVSPSRIEIVQILKYFAN